jgi:Glycosyl hydrolase family 26
MRSHGKLSWALLVSAVSTSLVLGAAALPASAVPSGPAVPVPSGTHFGSYVQPSGWSREQVMAAVEQLEADIGRKLDVNHLFYQWDGNFPGWKEDWDIENGRIPMISWRNTFTSTIVNGSEDSWITEKADALAALGAPVLLRWFGEMDGDVWVDEVGSPAQFISAWRRMHDIFISRGATNVDWVWCPNASAFNSGEAQTFYPGDAYVDWICADGYNWAPVRPGSTWNSFASIFAGFYAWAAPKGKPLMIGETGALERNPGEKGQWITDMGTSIKTAYPAIKALVYFDAYAPSNQGDYYDWRVDTSTSSYNAYIALAADPHFNPGGGPPPPPPGDTTPPSVPQNLQANAPSGTQVNLSWNASTDNVGVTAYDVHRGGALVGSPSGTSYSDLTVSPGVTYTYTVRARDAAGNVSSASSAVTITTPPPPPPPSATVFADGFESGTMSLWSTNRGMIVQSQAVGSGAFAARATGSGTGRYATNVLGAQYSELFYRMSFNILSQGPNSVYLGRFRTSSHAGIASLYVRGDGKLSVYVDVTRASVTSSTSVSRGVWHSAELHVRVAGSSSLIEVWLDGAQVAALTSTANLGSAPIQQLQLGDNISGRTYDVAFDDVAVGTGFLP